MNKAEAMPYTPDRGVLSKVTRRLTQWRHAAPVTIAPERPILTLSFDDCPKSAVNVGAPIMEELGVRGSYYVATGLLDQDTHMGRMANRDDVRALLESGHEIGAHTHSHLDCRKAEDEVLLDEVSKNLLELDTITQGHPIESFAFPYGETSFRAKLKLSRRFTNLRGVLSGINSGNCDRAQLRAIELEGDPASAEQALFAIRNLAEHPGWLILFSHDVSDTPSSYGVTPSALRSIIETAKDLGVEILTAGETAKKLGFFV